MLPTTNKGENDNEKVDVIIVGAGPGGIFSAYELVTNNSEIKVAVFEKGHLLLKRENVRLTVTKLKSAFHAKPVPL